MIKNKNKSQQYTLLVIILLLGGFLFFSLIAFFTAFLGSMIFYVLTKNLMIRLVEKYHWKKSLAAILIILMTFFIILLPISLMVSLLYGKVSGIIANPDKIVNLVKELDAMVYEKVHFKIISQKTMDALPSIGSKIFSTIVSTSLNTFSSIGMLYFFLYFMLVSYGKMEESLIKVLPFNKKNITLLGKELYMQTVSNSLGVPLIGLAQGLCGFIAYKIAGVPEAGLWGVLTGFASIIPVIGATIIWAPIALYLFAQHQIWQGFVVLAICGGILGLLDNVIRFVLAKKMADVHPVITILGVIMGLNYFGISGLIVGPLLISYFFILIKMYFNDYIDPQQEDESGE